MALEDVSVDGHTLRQGQQIGFMLGAANHDPEKFSQPHKLDIARRPNPHLAFGGGIHYCLGAPLARLEGQIAVNSLLRRMPNLTLAIEAPEYHDNYVLRGLKALPVTF
jgi:cytochrome P450